MSLCARTPVHAGRALRKTLMICGPNSEWVEEVTRRLSENRDRREKVGKRGKTRVSSRRIARYLMKIYASLTRFYRFRSRFSILRQPPRQAAAYRFTPPYRLERRRWLLLGF
jgi:hypothetical protein